MLIIDIETVANEEALQFMPEPKAPGNYTDPVKIAAYITDKKLEVASKAALDPDYGMIKAIGYRTSAFTRIDIVGVDHTEEEALEDFWRMYALNNGEVCGYNIIGFDLPYILRRSFALNVHPPSFVKLQKYQIYPILDLMGVLYNWSDYKSLKFVAKRYGIAYLEGVDGSMVGGMDNEHLIEYLTSDLNVTWELYERMKGVYFGN